MDFARAIQCLTDAEVEFVVIGGLSAALRGRPKDLLVRPEPEGLLEAGQTDIV